MIHFYLKSAFRNAQKNKTMSFAKLFGIGISFAVILFSMAYVYHETSFDKCVPDYNKKYRCLTQGKIEGRVADFAVTSPKMAQTLVDEIPEIKKAIRIQPRGNASFKYNEKILNGGELVYADPGFFSFFGIAMKEGIPNPLEAENNVIISKSLVNKHFGTVEEALNKKIELRGDVCLISGVFDDFPVTFHLKADIIRPLKKLKPEESTWNHQYLLYLSTNQWFKY